MGNRGSRGVTVAVIGKPVIRKAGAVFPYTAWTGGGEGSDGWGSMGPGLSRTALVGGGGLFIETKIDLMTP